MGVPLKLIQCYNKFLNIPNIQSNTIGYFFIEVLYSRKDRCDSYSYDISGNVKILWQDIPELEGLDATAGLKRLDYDYDIISGKVNRLSYQQGNGDQFFYQYTYDADNRVIGASTSRDGLLWHQDASYRYYLHGPLARVELGTDKVQGVDYAYTLQGWLKGINSSFLGADKDMAGDGLSTSIYAPYARNVYGLTLGYYPDDYSPIGSTGATAFPLSYTAPSTLQMTGNSLYNGNISQSTLGLSLLNGALPVGYSYGYDQLNRIVGMRQHSITSGQGTWSSSNIINDYKEDVTYDANGNILKYLRNGTTQAGNPLGMDSLTYYYNNKTNQLNVIHDSVPAGNYINDLDNQSANNYTYDSIGNGIQDYSASTSNIKWTVYGKIKQGSGLGYTEYFRYDAGNNRIIREMQYNELDNTLYYIRDAQGNTLATYNYDGSNLSWVEQDLYGSSRVGIWNWKRTLPSRTMVPQSETDTLSDWYMLGTRSYELTNHLENVLGVISDKKIGVSSGGGVVNYYKAEVLSQQDYYPFGMEEPVRGYNAGSYAYGFNGKRMETLDSYITDLYDYGNRMYYGKVGRFFTVDPVTQKYPELTPYQFASNRPIDGIDLDGLEYVTRVHTVNSRGQIIATKDIIYYKMNEQALKAHGGTPPDWYNAAGYGPEGKGVKHEYYYANGQQAMEPVWEQRQNSLINSAAYHGLYSGNGSITYTGKKDYDFSWHPIDQGDAIAKRHDMNYAKVGAYDVIEDTRTLFADKQMVEEASQFLKSIPMRVLLGDRVAGETVVATESQKQFIGILADYKKWKVNYMLQHHLDPTSIEDNKKVSLNSWRTKLSYLNSDKSRRKERLFNLSILMAAKSQTDGDCKIKCVKVKKEE